MGYFSLKNILIAGVADCIDNLCSSDENAELEKRGVKVTTPRLDIFAPTFECTPGSDFVNSEGCTCKCLRSGKTAFCDRDDCTPTIAHIQGKQGLHRQVRSTVAADVCTPGESFLDDKGCNTCYCGPNGKRSTAACTEILCLRRPIRDNEAVQSGDSCTPGQPFPHSDGCNSCVCGPLGKKSVSPCSLKLCRKKREELEVNQDTDSCAPGESFLDDEGCNTCVCGPMGKRSVSACTQKLCLTQRPKRDNEAVQSTKSFEDSCTPGVSFPHLDGCNECVCGPLGKKSVSACTLKLCRKKRDESQVYQDACTPGESFLDSEGCNTCM